MRGRVAVLLSSFLFSLFPFLFPHEASAQCSWTPRLTIPFRTTALDVAADGANVWLATSYGVQLLTNDGTRIADAVALPGTTRVVRPDGRGLAYAGSGSRVYVLRNDANNITVVRGVDAGAAVNDILISGSYLFVATANGVAHFDLFDPANPTRTSATLFTSSPNVLSLASASSRLYAADNDTSLEVFNISIPSAPQHTSTLATLRATSVHATPDGTVYVSDALGLNTDVFAGGTTKIGRLATGTNAFAPTTNGVHYSAGAERTIRAIDFTSTSTVKERFETQLAPTAGTDNVIHAMARSGNKLFVAAGDIGLAVLDVGNIAPPYPVVAYRSGATTSAAISGDRAWFADAAGNITETTIDANGIALNTVRTWAGGTLVHQSDGTTLLASNGAKATLWSLAPATPTGEDTTFPAAIKNAAIVNGTVIALLEDGNVWAGSQQVALPKIAFMGASGANVVFVELTKEGRTILHRYGSAQTITIDGTAIGGVAVSATEAAVFTFAGVNVASFAGGAVRVLADSPQIFPRQIAMAGTNVLLLDRRTLYVFDGERLIRRQQLPADGVAIAAKSSIAVVATNDGTSAISYLAAQPTPSIAFANSFYSKLVQGGDRTYLMAGDTIDIFTSVTHFEKKLTSAGMIDLAATNDALFTLAANGVVTAYSRWGVPYATFTIDEGSDAQMLSIDTAGNAVWVSLSKGCTTGACQKKTLVLDPQSLAPSATLTGGITDVVTTGTRAYALLDFPSEIRVYNIADPLHPSQLIAAAAPSSATSIAAYPGRVYVAGDRLYEYTETTLLLKNTHLTAVTPDKAQQVRVDGSCLVITARSANPEAYDAATMAPATTFEVPSAVRTISTQTGTLTLLTNHSVEVWSTSPSPPRKRRAS
ncbi:MAG TPA: hypothetical protein VM733_06905 [Thermoanaerobaculia bacterium]|nr:hypothetical protein [Thermoanaerobaculia bacterium]